MANPTWKTLSDSAAALGCRLVPGVEPLLCAGLLTRTLARPQVSSYDHCMERYRITLLCAGLLTRTLARPQVSSYDHCMERYRITPDVSVYYLTYTIVDWLPLFVSSTTCNIVTDSLKYCHQHKHLRINAYVIMPTHMHLIAFDADYDSTRLQSTLTDFR